jgi:NADH-quinone oxidoreductase subunit J
MFETAVFYAFASVLLVSGMLVVTARNPVHGVLLLRAEFLAIALVVVYVGAVMVLFLFVVMMLDINLERVREGFWRNLPLALVVGGIMVIEMVFVLMERVWGAVPTPAPAGYSNTKALGRVLYTQYAYAFEIAAVILLVAIVAAIALTLRQRKDSRHQDPAAQVRARREERVQLVSMPAEKDQ